MYYRLFDIESTHLGDDLVLTNADSVRTKYESKMNQHILMINQSFINQHIFMMNQNVGSAHLDDKSKLN